MNQKRIYSTLIFSIVFLTVLAQKPEVFSTDAGAIGGYDPVAFFKESKPVVGKKEFSQSWNGAVWYFSTAENLEAFKADPEKFAPQFGGWCAYGTADGHKSPTLPETWTMVDNKLYFNYNKEVQKLWNKNQKGLIDQANRRWPEVRKQ